MTARGLAQLEARVRELEAERSAARAAGDGAALARDRARPALLPGAARQRAPGDAAGRQRRRRCASACGCCLRLADGSEREFQLVGEDEADPKAGLISYVSPLAAAMMGKGIGEQLPFGAQTAEIVGLES